MPLIKMSPHILTSHTLRSQQRILWTDRSVSKKSLRPSSQLGGDLCAAEPQFTGAVIKSSKLLCAQILSVAEWNQNMWMCLCNSRLPIVTSYFHHLKISLGWFTDRGSSYKEHEGTQPQLEDLNYQLFVWLTGLCNPHWDTGMSHWKVKGGSLQSKTAAYPPKT